MTVSESAARRTTFDSIDDFLGPRAHRFFGEGFKRAVHRISDARIGVAPDGSAVVTARLGVDYPADWSRKGEHDQRAHLSTVDFIVLGARLIELCLRRVRGLTAGQLAGAQLTWVRIKAGSAPVEERSEEYTSELQSHSFIS